MGAILRRAVAEFASCCLPAVPRAMQAKRKRPASGDVAAGLLAEAASSVKGSRPCIYMKFIMVIEGQLT